MASLSVITRNPLAAEATAGPAGRYGTLPLPSSQHETSVAASGSQVVVAYNDRRLVSPGGVVRVLWSFSGSSLAVNPVDHGLEIVSPKRTIVSGA
jgi:hypothetical protein